MDVILIKDDASPGFHIFAYQGKLPQSIIKLTIFHDTEEASIRSQ